MMSQSRRDFLRTVGAAAAGAALGPSFARGASNQSTAPAKRPRNILFLMCDQHRPDALGRYGDPYALTPALDALAASGMSFRQNYTQNPICVPARNSILMGRYCHSTGALTNGYGSRRDLTTIPQLLRSKGYRTACFGKLHVKGRNDLDWDEVSEGGAKHGRAPEGAVILETRLSGRQPIGAPSPFSEEETNEWAAKEKAIAFMKANRGRPWFVQCSMHKPHPPFQPPKRYWDMIDRSKLEIPRYPENDLDGTPKRYWEGMVARRMDQLTDDQVRDGMQGYYGNLAFADAMLGEVIKALGDLGLREETLIVYTADHGEMLYDHRLWTKMVFFDPSVRVPLILSCPGAVPAGRETKALTQHIDLFPTFMDLLGFETPQSVQGLSLVPLLTGAKDAIHDVVFSEHYYSSGTGVKPSRMVFDGRYKYIDNGPDDPAELYDRQTDPREIANLCQAPQPAQRERIEALAARLREFAARDLVEPVRKGARAAEEEASQESGKGAKGKKGGKGGKGKKGGEGKAAKETEEDQ
ncbi:MAG: sulfatase-like hydrolase/transferase [Candidatus Sumerlaeota bacterium]|nr:sulfatase-like hydrolase/transferase [Candidatus Sumerlaeota bacterium]